MWICLKNALRFVLVHAAVVLCRLIFAPLQFNPLERPPSMDEILAELEAIRAPFLGSSSSPQASDRVEKDANITVHFSEEQTAIFSEALAHTGSANVTPFMRSFMSLSVVDVFERKHEPVGGGAAAAAAQEGH